MRKLLIWLFLLALIVGPVAFVLAAFEPDPALPVSEALSPRQAAESRALVQRIRAAAESPDGGSITATRAELDGLIATAARAAPSLRGRTQVGPQGVTLAASAQAPGLPEAGWVNLRAEVAASDQGLELRALRLGRMDLPPGLTLAALRLAADLATTDDLGTLLISSVGGVETSGDRVALRLEPAAGGSLIDRVVSGVREAAGLGSGADVQAHYEAMTQAALDGRLPARGSAAPWIAFAAKRAAAEPGARDAAILALAAHCGSRSAIETVVGGFDAPRADSPCEGTELAGRNDLRRHFTLSAGFQAAGGSAASFGLGEVKELVDASGGGSGFSFDDIAADRAGIRWAERVMQAPAGELEEIARRSAQAEAVMPSIRGLPSFMQRAEFRARYGEPDSPRYRAQIEEIDARIDALPLYR